MGARHSSRRASSSAAPRPAYNEAAERSRDPASGATAFCLHVLRASAGGVRASKAETPAWMQRTTRFGCTIAVPGHFELVLPPTFAEGSRQRGTVAWRGAAAPVLVRVAPARGSTLAETLAQTMLMVQVTRASNKAPQVRAPAKKVAVAMLDLWSLLSGPSVVQLRLAPNGGEQMKQQGCEAEFIVLEVRLEQICEWRITMESLACTVSLPPSAAAAALRAESEAAIADTGIAEDPALAAHRDAPPHCSTSVHFEDSALDLSVCERSGGVSTAVVAARVAPAVAADADATAPAGSTTERGAAKSSAIGATRGHEYSVSWTEAELGDVEVRGQCGFRQLSGGALFVELVRLLTLAGASESGGGDVRAEQSTAFTSGGDAAGGGGGAAAAAVGAIHDEVAARARARTLSGGASPSWGTGAAKKIGCCWVTLEQLRPASTGEAALGHWAPGAGTDQLFTFTSAMFNHGRRNGALSGCVRVSGLPIGIQMLGALRTLSGDVVASTAAFHVAAVPCASLRGGGGGGGGVPSGGSAAAATLSAVADGRSAEGDAERDGKDGDAVPAVGSTRTAAFGAAARRRSAASRNAKRSANSAKSARGAKGGTPQSPTRSGASLWKRVRTMRRGGRPAEVSDPSELPSLSAEATPSERHQYMELLMGAMQRAAPRVVGGRRRRRCLPLAAEPLLKLASRLHASLRCEDGSAGIDPHLADGVALLLGDCIAMVASLAMGAAGRGERGAVSHSRAALAFSQRAASRSEARPLRGAACCDFSDVLELRSLQVLFLRIIGDAHGVVTAPHRESHGDTAPARRLAYELITALLWRPELCEMHLLGFGPELAEIDDWALRVGLAYRHTLYALVGRVVHFVECGTGTASEARARYCARLLVVAMFRLPELRRAICAVMLPPGRDEISIVEWDAGAMRFSLDDSIAAIRHGSSFCRLFPTDESRAPLPSIGPLQLQWARFHAALRISFDGEATAPTQYAAAVAAEGWKRALACREHLFLLVVREWFVAVDVILHSGIEGLPAARGGGGGGSELDGGRGGGRGGGRSGGGGGGAGGGGGGRGEGDVDGVGNARASGASSAAALAVRDELRPRTEALGSGFFHLIPGYREVLKALLLELRLRSVRGGAEWPPLLRDAIVSALVNPINICVFVPIVLSKALLVPTRAARLGKQESTHGSGLMLGMVAEWCAELVAQRGCALPRAFERGARSALFQTLRLLLLDDRRANNLRALCFLYHAWPLLASQRLSHYARELLASTAVFEKLCFHWEAEVRGCFLHVVLFRAICVLRPDFLASASRSDVDARQTAARAENRPRNFLSPSRAVSDERAQLEAISGLDAATLARLTMLDAAESSPHVSWPPRFVSPSRGAASWSTSTPRASRRELSFGAAPRASAAPGGSIGGVRSPSGAAGRGRARKRASARVKTGALFGDAVESSSSDELRRSDRAIARLTQQLQDARLVAREARIANSKRERESARAAAGGGAAVDEPEVLGKGLSKAPYLFAAVGQLIAIEREQTSLIRALASVSRAHRVASGVGERRMLARADAEWRSLEVGVAQRAPFPSATRMESVQKVTGCFEQQCLRLL